MEIKFEPTHSFCYRFARYTALPEILVNPEVTSGKPFRLIEYAREVIDKYLTPEQQAESFKRARSEGYVTIGKSIRFYIPFLAKNKGMLTNLGDGIFRLPTAEDISDEEIEEADAEIAAAPEDEGGDPGLTGTVYAYTFPLLMKENAPFPIKIGKASGDVDKRVAVQCRQAASFEGPIIIGRWVSDRVGALEYAIHYALEARGKWRATAPGTEWFDTTVSEIDSIVRFIQTGRSEG